ncbi:MAG: phosphoribosylformylglycinamidine synthase subunit PurQ [Verrucomicrobiota bacterium]|nr:phosphoribosylformylglycinamidine synthase subunit PurQ [Verrucomicrobiota bacterium]
MKAAVVRFPGSNCDQDCYLALRELGVEVDYVWHKEESVAGYDLIVLPGGFSYGDYLRCGAIARFSPVMKSVIQEARSGKLVLGICNGFQILCEAGLLPGALIRNRSLHFICEHVNVRVENIATPWTNAVWTGTVLNIPIAHGEGNYTAEPAVLAELQRQGQILLRYCDRNGATTGKANPNGSADNIAGICNREQNIVGLMPHPERACDPRLGSTDGRVIFESALVALKA